MASKDDKIQALSSMLSDMNSKLEQKMGGLDAVLGLVPGLQKRIEELERERASLESALKEEQARAAMKEEQARQPKRMTANLTRPGSKSLP